LLFFLSESGTHSIFQSRPLPVEFGLLNVNFVHSLGKLSTFVGEFRSNEILQFRALPLEIGELFVKRRLPLIGCPDELRGAEFPLDEPLFACIKRLLDLAAVVGQLLRLLPERALFAIQQRELTVQTLFATIEFGKMDSQIFQNVTGFVERFGVGDGRRSRPKVRRSGMRVAGAGLGSGGLGSHRSRRSGGRATSAKHAHGLPFPPSGALPAPPANRTMRVATTSRGDRALR
jgi:hypothetical protein